MALKARLRWLEALLLVRLQSLQEVMPLMQVLRLLTLQSLLAVLQATQQLLRDLLPLMLRERLARQLQKWVLQQQTLQL